MPYKTIRIRKQTASATAAAARTLAAEVQQGFAERAKPFLQDGEALPDLVFLQELLARWLETDGTRLLDRDEKYALESIRSRDAQERLRRSAELLRGRLRDVRHFLDRTVGVDQARKLLGTTDFSKAPPQALVQVGRQARGVLRDPEQPFQAVAKAEVGVLADAGALAEALDREVAELQGLIDAASPALRAKQAGLGAKVADLQALTEATRRGAHLLFGLYKAAGLDFHAERLRPRLRAKAREAEPPPKPGGTPSGKGEAGPISGKEGPTTGEMVH